MNSIRFEEGDPHGAEPILLERETLLMRKASGVAKVTSLMRIASLVANVTPVKIPVFRRRESP